MSIILPRRYGVSTHAAERFIERIIGREEYTEDDVGIARIIIYNILSRRALKAKKIDQYLVRIRYRNAVFIYDTEQNMIVTVYPDEMAREKIEWVYKFPAGLRLEKQIATNIQVKLITYGFTPLRLENQILIGQIGEQLFSYDIKHNFIKPY